MLRPGQFSLAYLFLEILWVSLAAYFFRLLFLAAADVASPSARMSLILPAGAAFFFLSIAIGGLGNYRGMRQGLHVGMMILGLALYLLFLAAALGH
jgi:hypothetical protein